MRRRRRAATAAGAVAWSLGMGLGVAGCASGGTLDVETGPEATGAPAEAGESSVSAEAGAASEAATGTDPTGGAAEPAHAGIYTESQAGRGRASFEETCSECHTTGEFRGRGFQANWGRRTVYSLFRTMRSTMPDNNPGGLEETVYLDVLAYILKMNGHAAGPADLSADSPMREVRVAPPGSGS